MSKTWQCGGWSFTPSADATLIHALKRNQEINTAPGFASFDGSDWKTYGRPCRRHRRLCFKVGLAIANNRNFDMGFSYTHETRKDYTDHKLALNAGLSF